MAAHPEHEVTLVAEKGITQHRLRMGWSNPDFGNALVLAFYILVGSARQEIILPKHKNQTNKYIKKSKY